MRANSKEFEDLLEYWDEELHGGRLSFEHQSEILALVQRHGASWVKAAMKEASDVNGGGNRYRSYGVNMQLFRGVVRRKLNPSPKPRGGEKIAGRIAYEPDPRGTDTSWIYAPE